MYKAAITAIALALVVSLGACGGEELGTPGTGQPNPGLAITPGPDATVDPESDEEEEDEDEDTGEPETTATTTP